jgi:hypothetical protein
VLSRKSIAHRLRHSCRCWVPTRRRGRGCKSDRGADLKGVWHGSLNLYTSYMVVLAAADLWARRRHIVPLLSPWLSSVQVSSLPPPVGRLGLKSVGRRLASALPWSCFPAVCRELQHLQPTVDPSLPSSPPYAFAIHAPPPKWDNIGAISGLGKSYRTG